MARFLSYILGTEKKFIDNIPSVVELGISQGRHINTAKEYLLLIVGMASWATLYPLTKLLSGSVDPYLLAFVRYAIASVILLALLFLSRTPFQKPQGRDWIRFLLLGFVGTALTTVLITLGVGFATASASSILVNTNPLIVAMIAPFFLKERTSFRQIFGIIIGMIGVGLVALDAKAFSTSYYLTGAFFLLGAAACQAAYVIGMMPLVRRYGSFRTTVMMVIAGSITLLPILLARDTFRQVFLFSQTQWLALLLIGLVSTALGVAIWIRGLGVLSATSATSFKLLIPVFATIYGMMLLGEHLTIWIASGMVFTTVGIVFVQKKIPQHH